MGAQVRQISSWEDLPATLAELRELNGQSLTPLLFRGQENADWQLQTTLEREASGILQIEDYYRLISKIRLEIESFTESRWQIPDFVEVSKKCQTYDGFSLDLSRGAFPGSEYAGFLRHHGFPSPLLDWTRSPYVAAFFAFQPEGTRDRAIYVFADQPANMKARGSDETNIFNLGSRVGAHRRHFLQQSAYTICVHFDQRGWRFGRYEDVFEGSRSLSARLADADMQPVQQDVLWKLILPTGERVKVLRLLDEHNLNAFSLFGSTESLMATMAAREIELATRAALRIGEG